MTVLFDVFVLARSVGRMIDEALDASGLNSFDYAMTSMLRVHGPITPQRVGELTAMKATTTSGVLRRLERRGFVERRPHPDDGRSVLVALTESGEARTASAQAAFEEVLGRVETALGERLPSVRLGLQELDDAVRGVLGVAGRPYRVEGQERPPDPGLGPQQQEEARRFHAWLLQRDGTRR